jgi:hypothetical protein
VRSNPPLQHALSQLRFRQLLAEEGVAAHGRVRLVGAADEGVRDAQREQRRGAQHARRLLRQATAHSQNSAHHNTLCQHPRGVACRHGACCPHALRTMGLLPAGGTEHSSATPASGGREGARADTHSCTTRPPKECPTSTTGRPRLPAKDVRSAACDASVPAMAPPPGGASLPPCESRKCESGVHASHTGHAATRTRHAARTWPRMLSA